VVGLSIPAASAIRQVGLSRRKAGDRDAVRAARDIVQADLVAERDTRRLAAVLAADAELDVRRTFFAALR